MSNPSFNRNKNDLRGGEKHFTGRLTGRHLVFANIQAQDSQVIVSVHMDMIVSGVNMSKP